MRVPSACGIALLAFLSAGVAQAQPAREEIRCAYESRAVCGAAGCRPLAVGDEFLVMPTIDDLWGDAILWGTIPSQPLPEIRRCDGKGCTPLPVVPSLSGAFLNLSGGGYLLKLVTDDLEAIGMRQGSFVEVATSMLDTYIGRGVCR
jgi:hypothetical protein